MDTTTLNPIARHYGGFITLFERTESSSHTENQIAFFQWIIDSAKQVEVTPITEIPEAELPLKYFEPAKKECYNNALQYGAYNEKETLVAVGLYINDKFGIPLMHAWNYLPASDTYIDVTAEVALEGSNHYTYHQIALLTVEEFGEYCEDELMDELLLSRLYERYTKLDY